MEAFIVDNSYLYIVLTRTNTTLSKLIHALKQDEYTHAAISLDKELSHMYSFARRDTYNPFVGRFKREDIHEGVYHLCTTLPGTIIEVEVSKEQYEKAKTLLDHFILNGERYKYNYRGLVDHLLKRDVCRKDRFLCSEFVYHILSESGIIDAKMPRNLVRPQDLLRVKGRTIYKGDLKKMKVTVQKERAKKGASCYVNAI